MTTFKNTVNAFGSSAGDSISTNSTSWCGRSGMPKGKLKNVPSSVANIEHGNRRLAKANYGAGSGHSVRGHNAFSKGGKGK
jgi:hypothetical protein